MDKTALNLIAIGIFAITLSVLVGPLFNLSPVIPAAITFGILSLTTIDTLSWQNKGSIILLDLFSSKEHRERVLHHEAGHFLVAYLLGIPITGYTLSAWEAFKQKQPGQGGVTFDTENLFKGNNQELNLIVERFATVLMAGIAAENIVYGNTEGGGQDQLQYRQLLANLNNSPSIYPQKEGWAILQATNIIQKNKSAYLVLVEAMRKKSTFEQCVKTIQDNLCSMSA